MTLRLFILTLVTVGLSAWGQIPPRNPFLANSPWPLTHANPYAQGSSPLAGPTSGNATVTFVKTPRASITLGVTIDPILTYWGSSPAYGTQPARLFLMESSELLVQKDKFRGAQLKNAISGAYVILDNLGIFWVPESDHLVGYRRSGTAIEVAGSVDLRSQLAGWTEGQHVVGINMTYDGYIAVITNQGLVGVVSRDSILEGRPAGAALNLDEAVSNSIAVDETGGIFVLSETRVVRVQWRKPLLEIQWSYAYPSENKQFNGTLGKGSGTTPTLMGDGQNGVVALCDGLASMNLLLVWRNAIPADWKPGQPEAIRRVAASVPVTFGRGAGTKAITEQSLLAWENEVVVVDNTYGSLDKLKESPSYSFAEFALAKKQLQNDPNKLTIFFSGKTPIAPRGVEKFHWDSTKRELTSTWVNGTASCPNTIPTYGAGSDLFYCLGQENEEWGLLGLHWKTGERAFFAPAGNNPHYNSFWAATQVCADGVVCVGAFGGVLEFKENKEKQ